MCLVDISIEICHFACDVCVCVAFAPTGDFRNAINRNATGGAPVLDSFSSTPTVLWLCELLTLEPVDFVLKWNSVAL